MSSLLELVKHYQHYINKYPNDKDTVLKCIDLLYNLEVTVQHLQETGVGRTVNALRKEPGEVGQAARALVYKWKMMVASEESDHEEDKNDSTSYNEPDYDRNCNPSESKNRHVKSEKHDNKPKTEENHSRSHHTTNGDYSGSKRKYHSSEEEDLDRKKSKYSSTKDNGYKQPEIKVKVEPSDSESDSEDSESSSSDEEKPDIKVKIEKTEKIEKHETTSHKHPHSSHDKHKYESSSGHTKEHYKHNNLERHSSSKDKSSSSHSQSSSRESSKVVEKEHKSDKDKSHSKESSDRHKTHKDSEKHKSSSSSEKQKSSSSSEKHKSNDNSEKHRSSSSSEKHKHSSSSEKHKSNSSSVDKHGSSSSSEKHKSTNSERQKSYSERSSSHSEKHSSSSKTDKDKHKSSSEKEITNDKHKLKETNTSSSSDSSSKDKQSSSSKEKSKDKHSSKEKETSHKSDKKHSSSKELKSSDSKKKHESNVDTSSKKSKHKSSSSSSKSSSSKSKDDIPKKKSQVNGQDSDDGIDCGSGASFAEALGMISPAKPKKKSFTRDSTQSPNSCSEDLSPATLLAPTAKLAPLPALEISALPEISPNYRPRPPPKFLPHFTDEDAMSVVISSKNQRTKVYSGNKVMGKIPTLYEMCVNILQEHIDALEYTGGVPYEILKPVVDKATPQQLFMLEHFNPYLMEDTDHLWQKFCEKSFRNKKREEMESWREMYMRCQEEQEMRLKSLTANIRITQAAKKAPIKQTKMAYVDSVVKPPRNVLKKQAQHGTAFAATASPAARVAALAAAPNVLKGGRAAPAPVLTPSSAALKPKKAPLMQKALQFMRGKKR